MVWMSASLKHGFHLHVFPSVRSQGNRGTVTGAIFDEAMKKRGGLISYLKRYRSSVIAMDNCTVHNLARTSFQETGITVLPWPAKSPDLMPVENLWSIMDNFKNVLALRNRTELVIAMPPSTILPIRHTLRIQHISGKNVGAAKRRRNFFAFHLRILPYSANHHRHVAPLTVNKLLISFYKMYHVSVNIENVFVAYAPHGPSEYCILVTSHHV